MGKRQTLAALAAAGFLVAGCVGAPVQPEEPATYQAKYLEGSRLEFEAEIDGETVREYWNTGGGYEQTFIEITKEGGSIIIYSDTWGTGYPLYWKELDEVVFIEGEEVLRFTEYEAMEIIEGEKIEYPEPGYSSGDFGVPVMERAQERFAEYLEKIDEYERQQDQAYHDSTLVPLQQWALERLVAPEPVLPTPEPVVEDPVEAEPVEPEPVDVEPREAHQYLQEWYIGRSELVWQEQTGRALVRMYEDVYEYATYLVVDQADGTSLFFSDWRDDQDLDAFAITAGGQTVFYEHVRMLVFKEGGKQETLYGWPPENVWAEARNMFRHYLPWAKQEQQKMEQLSAEEMENWALGELREK